MVTYLPRGEGKRGVDRAETGKEKHIQGVADVD